MKLPLFLFVTILSLPLCPEENSFAGWDWGFHNRELEQTIGKFSVFTVKQFYVEKT